MSITQTLQPGTASERAAAHMQALLAPFCEQIAIVGDVRRRVYTTSKLHLLVVPTIREKSQGTLFTLAPGAAGPAPVVRENLLLQNLDRMRATGDGGLSAHPKILSDTGNERAAPWGERERWLHLDFEGVTYRVFVYICERKRWGHMMLIRTGPEAFGREYVETLRQRHLVAAEGGIRDKRTGELQPCYREVEAFGFVGWGYVQPHVRR